MQNTTVIAQVYSQWFHNVPLTRPSWTPAGMMSMVEPGNSPSSLSALLTFKPWTQPANHSSVHLCQHGLHCCHLTVYIQQSCFTTHCFGSYKWEVQMALDQSKCLLVTLKPIYFSRGFSVFFFFLNSGLIIERAVITYNALCHCSNF